jgi:hypothetical protein
MRKLILLLAFILLGTASFAQIEIGNKKEKDRKKEQKMKDDVENEIEKKKKKKEPLQITGRNVYLGISLGQSYRNLKPSDNIFSRPLDQKKDEELVFSLRASGGMQVILFKHLMLDFGFSYTEQGEQYSFTDPNSDSTYAYINKYRYIGIPLTINGIFGGERIRFYFGGGLIPSMFINLGQKTEYTTETGTKFSTKENIRTSDYNQFQLMAIGKLGMHLNLTKHVGFYLAPELRYNILNTFQEQYKHVHHQWAWGIDFGLLLFL